MLRTELGARESGGFYICTIQKFCDREDDKIGLINDRANIICFSDEAHRTQLEHAKKIKLYIEQHVSQPLRIVDLMELTHFSQSYIYAIFRETYDTSPLQYHTQLRVQKAKSMLRNTNMSITEISDHLGFQYVQDFCRVFKKVDGYSPSIYRHLPDE